MNQNLLVLRFQVVHIGNINSLKAVSRFCGKKGFRPIEYFQKIIQYKESLFRIHRLYQVIESFYLIGIDSIFFG